MTSSARDPGRRWRGPSTMRSRWRPWKVW